MDVPNSIELANKLRAIVIDVERGDCSLDISTTRFDPEQPRRLRHAGIVKTPSGDVTLEWVAWE